MSLDRLQSKAGLFQITPESVIGTTGTASTAASYLYPGGLAVGGEAGFAPGQATGAGGALFMTPYPRGTAGQAMTTGGTIAHNGAGYVAVNATVTANNLQLQPPQFPGQYLLVQNVGSVSCSVDTIGTVNNWSTSGTVTCQVLNNVVSFPAFAASSTGAAAAKLFVASPYHASTTGLWPVGLWCRVI